MAGHEGADVILLHNMETTVNLQIGYNGILKRRTHLGPVTLSLVERLSTVERLSFFWRSFATWCVQKGTLDCGFVLFQDVLYWSIFGMYILDPIIAVVDF